MATRSGFGDDFGQKVDLTASIRNILRNYPEGTAILKELVQNADDASARTVRFCLDRRQHGTANLADPALAQFQGPSLLVYNSAVFTEEDFKSIQRIGDSLKNHEQISKTKIGRFGIGFNAVYHWTELPSFISDKYLVMLDPQARFLPNVNPSNPGKIVNWIDHPEILRSFSDQFAPYLLPGMSWSKAFDGTLFRLPLRNASQAESSFLSKRAIDEHDVAEILQSLVKEASTMLLFLRNVERIDVQEWAADEPAPRTIYSCEIASPSPALRAKRSFDCVLGRNRGADVDPNRVICEDYSLDIEISSSSPDCPIGVERWEICTQFGGATATAIARNSQHAHLKLVPLAGTAACVRLTGNQAFDELRRGIAYCFLPLPIQTSLPVMVNGFFELSSNRRDIWQSGGDMTGDGHTRANWNLALLRDVVSPCYCRLLLRLRDVLGFSAQFQALWPSVHAPAPWSLVTKTTLALCRTQKLLRTTLPGDSGWIEPVNAVLVPLAEENYRSLDELYGVLDHFRAPVVRFECEDLHVSLIKTQCSPSTATPAYLRNLIRSRASDPLPSAACKFVLHYVLSDQSVSGALSALNDLSIVPLLDRSVGRLKIFTVSQCDVLRELQSMGFSLQDTMRALQDTGFDLMRACELLSDENMRQGLLLTQRCCYFLADNEERQVFRDAASILVDSDAMSPNELEFIANQRFQTLSNVRKFHASLVCDLLRQILPIQCMNGEFLHTSSLSETEREKLRLFLLEFWKYCALKPAVLASITQGPSLLPTSHFEKLLPISRIANAIVSVKDEQALPEKIVLLLNALEIPLVSAEHMGCDLNAMPSSFWEYVHPPTRKGVVAVIAFRLRDDKNKSAFDVIQAEQKHSLRSYLALGLADLNEEDLAVITTLPIFPVFSGNFQADSAFMTLQDSNTSLSQRFTLKDFAGIPAEWFPTHLVHHETMQEFALLAKLKVRCLTKAEFMRKYVLPQTALLFEKDPSAYEQAMIQMFSDMQQFVREDKQFFQVLRETRFIPCASKTNPSLCSAGELFDPTDKDMRALLDDRYFPAETFRAEELLVLLRSLGMKTIIDWEGVLSSARSVAMMDDVRVDEKQSKGCTLLSYLDKNIDRLLGVEPKKQPTQQSTGFSWFSSISSIFQEQDRAPAVSAETLQRYQVALCEIEWIPVMTAPTHSFMPWMSVPSEDNTKTKTTLSTPCAAPKQCASAADIWLCSASKRLVRESIHSEHLLRVFGWKRAVTDVVAATQLVRLSEEFSLLTQRLATEPPPSESMSPHNELTQFRQILTGVVPQIYRRLDDAQDVAAVRRALDGTAWIWMGTFFVPTHKVALSTAVNAAPYLFQVPEELKVYPNLLLAFRLNNQFSVRDYVSALAEMAADHGVISSSQCAGEPLPDALLDVAIALVTLVSAQESAVALQAQAVYVPDSTGRLALCAELLHDDVPWCVGPKFIGMRSTARFVHGSISAKVAAKLGVRSLRVSLVNNNSEQTLFNGVDATRFESFGQAESLTNRLKTILDLYPDGSPILNELVQNADDAGATVMRILVDESVYGRESLMDSRMEPLQGPALVIQNNARFSDADFRNLASVGQGSKLEKLATTGRFGLGFNSTYHLTDTPMFVSGDYFVFFDPHCEYVPGATPNQPGIRIKFSETNLRSVFPHQFEPFTKFDCDCVNTYNGTLFRFPLRTISQAKRSEICKRSYALSDVDSLVEQLVCQLTTVTLFLRSVHTIEIYRLADGAAEPTLLHSVNTQITAKATENDQALLSFFDKSSNSSSGGAGNAVFSKTAFYNKLQTVSDERLPVTFLEKTVRLTTTTRENVIAREESTFCIAQGLRGGRAKQLACSDTARGLKLIPFGAVAACVRRQVEEMQPVMLPRDIGHVFCFLPTPISSGLSVHMNAYWELSSNRRDIWRGEDTKGDAKLRSDWNKFVIEDVLAPLYCKLLVRINENIVRASNEIPKNKILELLPCPVPPQPWDALSKALFPLLKNERMLWTNLQGGQYLKCSEAYLLQSDDDGSRPNIKNDSEKLEQLLLAEGMPVVCVPAKELLACFIDAHCVAGAVNGALIREIFRANNARRHPVLEHDKTAESWNIVVENACFLLSIVIADLPRERDGVPQYESLCGVKLIPLDNRSVGTFSSALDGSSGLFLCSDTQRAILQRCSDKLLVSASLIRSDVLAHLEHAEFANRCNVRVLQCVDVLKLLSSIVPKQWMENHTVVVPRNAAQGLDDSWFAVLWKYILHEKLVELFSECFPLIPVCGIPSISPTAGGLAKISKRIPVLALSVTSFASKDEFQAVVEGLGLLGVFVLDEQAAHEFAHHADFKKLVTSGSAGGILDALSVCGAAATAGAAKWSQRVRLAMRKFLLVHVLARADSVSLSAEYIALLRELPVWLTHSAANRQCCAALSDVSDAFPTIDSPALSKLEFSSLSDVHCIAPPEVGNSLLSDSFVWLSTRIHNDNEEVSCFKKLGLATLSLAEFFASEVLLFPTEELTARFDTIQLKTLGEIALTHLSAMERERAGIAQAIGSRALFPNTQGVLFAARELYDPSVVVLPAVLPAECFPLAEYVQDTPRFVSLKKLGLRAALDCEGVLAATRAIESEQKTLLSLSQRDTNTQSEREREREIQTRKLALCERSRGVMRYLEDHAEELLQECDPQGLQQWRERESERRQPNAAMNAVNPQRDSEREREREGETVDSSPSPSPSQPPQRVLGGLWANELRATWWVLAHTTVPEQHARRGVPWPAATHASAFAAPSQSTIESNLWFASSSLRVCALPVRAPLLLALLGWDTPLSGTQLALQLVAMSATFTALKSESPSLSVAAMERVITAYNEVFPQLINKLDACFQSESSLAVKHWLNTVAHKVVIWAGREFVESSRFALSSSLSVSTEPFLFLVPPYLSRYRALLLAMGVKERFTARDLAALTARMFEAQGGERAPPLSIASAAVHVGIVQVMLELLEAEINATPLQESGTEGATESVTERTTVSVTESATERSVESETENAIEGTAEITTERTAGSSQEERDTLPHDTESALPLSTPHRALTTQDVRSLGSVYLPDSGNSLCATTMLFYNDAPWISPQTITERFRALRFAHGRVSAEHCALLGCRSLRELLFAGEDVVCPSVKQVLSALAEREREKEKDTTPAERVRSAVADVLYVADQKGCDAVEVLFDDARYAGESLLHPGLGAAQGAALLWHLPHCVLTCEDVSRCLSLPSFAQSERERETNNNSLSLARARVGGRFSELSPAVGRQFLSCFAVADCVQVLSGSELFVFDPCGIFLHHEQQRSFASAVSGTSAVNGGGDNNNTLHGGAARAQRFKLNGKRNAGSSASSAALSQEQDLLASFADQFQPFFSVCESVKAQLNATKRYSGTIVRMPLRTAPSPLSPHVLSLDELRAGLAAAKSVFSASLVFASTLRSISVLRCIPSTPGVEGGEGGVEGDGGRVLAYSVSLTSSVQERNARRKLQQSTGWERQSIVRFLTSYVAPEYSGVVRLCVCTGDVSWLSLGRHWKMMLERCERESGRSNTPHTQSHTHHTHALEEVYHLFACMGRNPLRDIALNDRLPFRALRLSPFVCVALQELSPYELSRCDVAPQCGWRVCEGFAALRMGLPFHIEGAFLESVVSHTHSHTQTHSHAQSHTHAQLWNDALLSTALRKLYAKALKHMQQVLFHPSPSLTFSLSSTPSSTSCCLTPSPTPSSTPSLPLTPRQLRGFYKHWVFLPRLDPHTKGVVRATKELLRLATQDPLFLLNNAFVNLGEVVLVSTHYMRSDVFAYLSRHGGVSLSLCPAQVSLDLREESVPSLVDLSPERLRAVLKRDAASHMSALSARSQRDVLFALVQHALMDIREALRNTQQDGEFATKRAIKRLAGVPLLLTADDKIKCFPSNASEIKAVLPSSCAVSVFPVALLPRLLSHEMHTQLKDCLESEFFRDALCVTRFDAAFLRQCVSLLLPPEWLMHSAIAWMTHTHSASQALPQTESHTQTETPTHTHTQPEAHSAVIQGYRSPSHLEQFLFTLWDNACLGGAPGAALGALRDAPLLPVCVHGGTRVLLPVRALAHVFVSLPSAAEERHRRAVRDEIESAAREEEEKRLKRERAAAAAAERETERESERDWQWTHLRVTDEDKEEGDQEASLCPSPLPSTQSSGAGSAVVSPSLSVSLSPSISPTAVDTHTAENDNENENDDTQSGPTELPLTTRLALQRLGAPFLDTRLFAGEPAALRDAGERSKHYGRRVLDALHFFSENEFVIFDALSSNTQDTPGKRIVDFSAISPSERHALLWNIYQAHCAEAFSEEIVERVKALPLFTSVFDEATPLSLKDCATRGVFYCADDAVLSTVRNASLSLSESAANDAQRDAQQQQVLRPAVLVGAPGAAPDAAIGAPGGAAGAVSPNAAQLHEVYRWLGVAELTPSLAVRRFVLSSMGAMSAGERLRLVQRLAAQWGTYRQDADLVSALKSCAFLPVWDARDPEAWQREGERDTQREGERERAPLRRCEELILWTNDELLLALRGTESERETDRETDLETQFFVPPSLRTAPLHAMFSDLGMRSELDEHSLIALLTALQTMGERARETERETERVRAMHACIALSRRVWHYALARENVLSLLENVPLARKVGRIQCVPVRTPVRTEEGAFVLYEEGLARFDACVSRLHGMTAFSVLPLLDDDLSPPSVFLSSLGVIAHAPPREIVLRHIRNLTQCIHLERWNAVYYTIPQAFNAIFAFLAEHWRAFHESVTRALCGAPLVPVGAALVPARRVFLRLGEDLAPLMHELPRHFGAHESFFKSALGVRDAPGAGDYVEFLGDLAEEMGATREGETEREGAALNPNEFRAVVTITQTIAQQIENVSPSPSLSDSPSLSREEEELQQLLRPFSAARERLFVPDERCVLRRVDQCVLNDHTTLRHKIGERLSQLGIYVLHPVLRYTRVGIVLRMNKLSAMVSEDTAVERLVRVAESDSLCERYTRVFRDASFLRALTALLRSESEKERARRAASADALTLSVCDAEREECVLTEQSVWHRLDALLSLAFVEDIVTTLSVHTHTATHTLTQQSNTLSPTQHTMATNTTSPTNTPLSCEPDRSLFFLHTHSDTLSHTTARTHTLFINMRRVGPPHGVSLDLALSLGLCRFFSLDALFASVLAELLCAQHDAQRDALLHALELWDDAHGAQALLRGAPRAALSREDVALLELRPMRAFRAGEIVAYEEDVAVDPSAGEGEGERQREGEENKTKTKRRMCFYGRVVASGDANELGVRRLDIRTGRGVEKMLSTDVFAFKSARRGGGRERDRERESGRATTRSGVSSIASTPAANTQPNTLLNPQANAPPPPPPTGNNGSEIAQDELLDALHGLLDRAGLPLSLNQKEMMAKILSLESQNGRAEEQLKSERQQQAQLRQSLETQLESFKCTICLMKNVDHVLVPCGHTFCEDCANQLRHNKCHYCRAAVQKKVKMFIGSDAT